MQTQELQAEITVLGIETLSHVPHQVFHLGQQRFQIQQVGELTDGLTGEELQILIREAHVLNDIRFHLRQTGEIFTQLSDGEMTEQLCSQH